MKSLRHRFLPALALALLASSAALAQNYTFKVVAQGLHRPTGIAVRGGSKVYFTEIPTPGVGGGQNAIKELSLGTGAIRTIHQGEPEPVNIAVDEAGVLYWVCKSAGVILEQSPDAPASSAVPLLTGLTKPSGIAIDEEKNASAVGTERRIDADGARVAAWVIPTDEELLIARDTWRVVTGAPLP